MSMYVSSQLGSHYGTVINPTIRTVTLVRPSPQTLVVINLRYGWLSPPPPNGSLDVRMFMQDHNSIASEVFDQIASFSSSSTTSPSSSSPSKQPPTYGVDERDDNTPWKQAIYYVYNHVFYDVMQFMQEVNCAFGKFEPPNVSTLILSKQKEDQDGSTSLVLKKRFNTDIVMMPAYIPHGYKIRVCGYEQKMDAEKGLVSPTDDWEEFALQTFSNDKPFEVVVLKKDLDIHFYLELEKDDTDPPENHPRAVMVVGGLVGSGHDGCIQAVTNGGDDDDEDDDDNL